MKKRPQSRKKILEARLKLVSFEQVKNARSTYLLARAGESEM